MILIAICDYQVISKLSITFSNQTFPAFKFSYQILWLLNSKNVETRYFKKLSSRPQRTKGCSGCSRGCRAYNHAPRSYLGLSCFLFRGHRTFQRKLRLWKPGIKRRRTFIHIILICICRYPFFWVTSSTLNKNIYVYNGFTRIGEFWLISKEITILLNPTFSMISKMPILLLKISPHNLRSTYLLYANRIYCTYFMHTSFFSPPIYFWEWM